MFYGLSKFIKQLLPKQLFYRSLLIVALPVIILQITISIVFFDSLWIKTNIGMTRALVGEVKTFIDTFNKDVPLFEKFHSSEWKDRLTLLDKFKDDRLVTFGHSLIFNEAPEILPKDIYKKIKRRIASRILSTNKEKWWTVSAFYSECDEIRENEDKMFSFKSVDEKLKFLDGINDYVMNLQKM